MCEGFAPEKLLKANYVHVDNIGTSQARTNIDWQEA